MPINGFKRIRTYGEMLFLVLFMMHAIAFFAFRWFETRESRLELSDIARSVSQSPDRFAAQHDGVVLRYPNGVIILQKNSRDTQNGFHEMKISGREYLVYTDNDSNILVAKPESDTHEELLKVLLVLAVLYFGEIVVLLGWWFYLKDQIKELFNVH